MIDEPQKAPELGHVGGRRELLDGGHLLEVRPHPRGADVVSPDYAIVSPHRAAFLALLMVIPPGVLAALQNWFQTLNQLLSVRSLDEDVVHQLDDALQAHQGHVATPLVEAGGEAHGRTQVPEESTTFSI